LASIFDAAVCTLVLFLFSNLREAYDA